MAKTGYPGESVGDIPQSEVREAIKNELAKAFNYKEVHNLIMDISGNCGIDKNLYLIFNCRWRLLAAAFFFLQSEHKEARLLLASNSFPHSLHLLKYGNNVQ